MDFQQIWGQALTTVAGAEEEAVKVLTRLQGVGQEESRKLAERLLGQRKELERRVDELVKVSVARLKVPTRAEIAQLNTRLDGLTRRIEALQK